MPRFLQPHRRIDKASRQTGYLSETRQFFRLTTPGRPTCVHGDTSLCVERSYRSELLVRVRLR